MTRHDADQVITGYVNPSGSGEGNWAEETIVGRITKSGTWDRRYAIRCEVCGAPRHPRIYGKPLKTNQDSASFKEFAAAFLVCLLVGAAFIIWTSILAVAS